MTQALALLVLGLQLYIVALTTPNLPSDVRDQAIALSSLATSTANTMMTASSAPVEQTQTTVVIDATTSVPNQQTQSMTDQQTSQTAQTTAPFVRTGDVSAQIVSHASELSLAGGRTIIATIKISNGTNETIRFASSGNINNDMVVSNSTIDDWTPSVSGLFGNTDFSQDQTGIPAGGSGDIQIIARNVPPKAGTFDLSMNKLTVAGLTSGDMIAIGGFPISFGRIEAR